MGSSLVTDIRPVSGFPPLRNGFPGMRNMIYDDDDYYYYYCWMAAGGKGSVGMSAED